MKQLYDIPIQGTFKWQSSIYKLTEGPDPSGSAKVICLARLGNDGRFYPTINSWAENFNGYCEVEVGTLSLSWEPTNA